MLADMIRHVMDVAVEADDDECKDRQENTGNRQAYEARGHIRAAFKAEKRWKDEVAGTKIGGKEGEPQDENIAEPKGPALL